MGYSAPNSYLARLAEIESAGNPNAKNPNSSAKGLYQFIDSTAKQYGLADPYDPEAATAAAQKLTDDNRAYLRKTLGREPSEGELYLAHQQGMAGAAKLLANPNELAANLVGADAVKLNGGNSNMTAQQFADKWISKFQGTPGIAPEQQATVLPPGAGTPIAPLAPDVPTAFPNTAAAGGFGVAAAGDIFPTPSDLNAPPAGTAPLELPPMPQPAPAPAAAPAETVDVQLPDGTVLKGVPANITKAQIMAKLKANGYDTSKLEGVTDGVPVPPPGVQYTDAAPGSEAFEAVKKVNAQYGYDTQPYPNAAMKTAPKPTAETKPAKPQVDYSPTEESANAVLQGATFGLEDEITSGIGTPLAKLYGFLQRGAGSVIGDEAMKNAGQDILDTSAGDLYGGELEKKRKQQAEFKKNNPKTALGLEIAGGFATGGGLAKLGTKVAPKAAAALTAFAKANPIKAAAAVGGGSGSLYGFGTGEGDINDRLGSSAVGGVAGTVGGTVGGIVLPRVAQAGGALVKKAGDLLDDTAVGRAAAELFKTSGKDVAAGVTEKPLSALSKLTPEQIERQAALKAVGIESPTAGMLTRDPKIWQFERNTAGIAGVGDDIRNRYIQANEAIHGALDDLATKTGGKATTPYEAGESVTDAVNKKSKEMQAKIGKMYTKIREQSGDDMGLEPNKLLTALDDAGDNAYADSIVTSMQRKMKKYGVIDENGQPTKAALSVKNAEELRKFANSLRGDHQTDHVVTNIINALDDDVIETAGDDAFKAARDAARNKFKEFETKTLSGISQGKIVSDDVLKKTVFGAKVQDLQAFKKSLLSGTKVQTERGTQAWNDLKLQTVKSIMDNSTSAGGKISGASLNRQLEKIGKERLETIFTPDELLRLRTIQKAAEYTTIEVPESFVNYSNTNAALQNVLQKSKLGNFLTKSADKVSQVPVLNAVAFPATATARMAGKELTTAAEKKSIKNVLNPNSALMRYTDPALVGKTGLSGGIMGNETFNDKRN